MGVSRVSIKTMRKMRKLKTRGLSRKEIAQQLGVSECSVSVAVGKRLAKKGLPPNATFAIRRIPFVVGGLSYLVYSDGRIWNVNSGRFVAQSQDAYVQAHLGSPPRTYKVHTIVLTAFKGPPVAGRECRHLDGNPRNNCLNNLKWGTRKENHADKKLHGTDQQGSKHHLAKLTEELVLKLRKDVLKWPGTKKEFDLKWGRKLGVSSACVFKARCGQSWSHV